MKSARLTSLLLALSLLLFGSAPAMAQGAFILEVEYTYQTYVFDGRQPIDGCDLAKKGAAKNAKKAGYSKLIAWIPLGRLFSTCKVASRVKFQGLPGRNFSFTAKGLFQQDVIVEPKPRCHPFYKNDQGVCVPNVEWPKYDVNCNGSAEYAPYYTDKRKKFKYHPGPDIFNLDKDKDKWACERPSPGTIGN